MDCKADNLHLDNPTWQSNTETGNETTNGDIKFEIGAFMQKNVIVKITGKLVDFHFMIPNTLSDYNKVRNT